MNRIDASFQDMVARGKKTFIAYITAGDPSLDFTLKAVEVLTEEGVDMIELGIPFSDPLADGPTIQRASNRALTGGVTIEGLFHLVERIRETSKVPLLFMGYYNSLYNYGVESFVVRCAEVGVDGLIIPDLPPEEGGRLKEVALKKGLATVFLLSPNSHEKRIRKVLEMASGFLYCVSVTGVTGVLEASFHQLEGLISRLRGLTSLPLAAGFGINTPQQAREVSSLTNGVIVGSAFVKIMEEHLEEIEQGEYSRALRELGHLAKSLIEALEE